MTQSFQVVGNLQLYLVRA